MNPKSFFPIFVLLAAVAAILIILLVTSSSLPLVITERNVTSIQIVASENTLDFPNDGMFNRSGTFVALNYPDRTQLVDLVSDDVRDFGESYVPAISASTLWVDSMPAWDSDIMDRVQAIMEPGGFLWCRYVQNFALNSTQTLLAYSDCEQDESLGESLHIVRFVDGVEIAAIPIRDFAGRLVFDANDRLYLAYSDVTEVFDSNLQEVGELAGTLIALSPNQTIIISIDEWNLKQLYVWDTATLSQRLAISLAESESRWLNDFEFFPGGDTFATLIVDEAIDYSRATVSLIVWDAISGQQVMRIDNEGISPCCLALSADGSLLAYGDVGGILRIYSATDGSLLLEIVAHDGEMRALDFSPDGKLLMTVGIDYVLRFWGLSGAWPVTDR